MARDSSRPPAPSGKRAERSRQAIVGAAREAFVRDGFDTGMDTIAASAGVSKVTVYNHFGSKEELFTEVIGQAMDEAHATLAEVRARLADAGDAREALIRTARVLVEAATDPARLALRNLVTSEMRRFPDLGDSYRRRGPARSAAAFGEVLGDLCERGLLDVPDVEVAVVQFFGLTLYPHLIVSSIGTALAPELTDRLITDGVEMFLLRYQPRSSS
ncbi:TetR/AcrR family transcriptional regulator [Actinomadura hibisca]|uniref:TetR/AcrR family transcriptional regulator n=1 Tax=Actinomadura hibisca TaxID=68565 RepID=UPI0008341742|nr:TetR/AcrR family transcriptional regulator [Actinomadura hibisca]